MQEHMVQTLHYDVKCCHVQGDCEWVPCKDTVAVAMAGGTIATPVTGVYVGADQPVSVPDQLVAADNTTLVLFQAFGVATSTIGVGGTRAQAQGSLRVQCLSPDGCTVGLAGGWWVLQHQNVRREVLSGNGTVVERGMVFSAPRSGQQHYNETALVEAAPPLALLTVVYTKVAQRS